MTEILLDSSILIDFFQDDVAPDAERYLVSRFAISMVTYYEVCKFFYQTGRAKDLDFIKQRLKSFGILGVSHAVCEEAARYSNSLGLSVADSIIYATARVNGMKLVTGDNDLKGKPDVIFVKRGKK